MSVESVIDAMERPLADVAEEVAGVVFAGGTVIIPNDTSYRSAATRTGFPEANRPDLCAVKGRPDNRPLTMHVASPQEFLEYAERQPVGSGRRKTSPSPVRSFSSSASRISSATKPRRRASDAGGFGFQHDPFSARDTRTLCGPLAGTTVALAGKPRYAGDADVTDASAGRFAGTPRAGIAYDRESSIVDLTRRGTRAFALEGVVSAAAARLSELLGPIESANH